MEVGGEALEAGTSHDDRAKGVRLLVRTRLGEANGWSRTLIDICTIDLYRYPVLPDHS